MRYRLERITGRETQRGRLTDGMDTTLGGSGKSWPSVSFVGVRTDKQGR